MKTRLILTLVLWVFIGFCLGGTVALAYASHQEEAVIRSCTEQLSNFRHQAE
jgi:hypothetical protein